ncbi:rhodanese-like domain-containing protein [bacterium]|nr:rhodanese-like domain-containing protein [bacterium]
MKSLRMLVPFAALLTMAFSCGNAGSKQGGEASEKIAKSVDASTFERMISEKPGTVLDVRTKDEFNSGHLENAVLIDWYSSSFAAEAAKLDKTKPIYVYCHSGGRSSSAMQKLAGMGFNEIYNLKGGIMAWNAAHR